MVRRIQKVSSTPKARAGTAMNPRSRPRPCTLRSVTTTSNVIAKAHIAAVRSAVRQKAPVGIEPTNRGFADLCLTTWLRRRGPRKSLEHYAFSTHLDGALFGARQLGALLGAVLQELKLSEDSLSLRPPSPRARDPTRQ